MAIVATSWCTLVPCLDYNSGPGEHVGFRCRETKRSGGRSSQNLDASFALVSLHMTKIRSLPTQSVREKSTAVRDVLKRGVSLKLSEGTR